MNTLRILFYLPNIRGYLDRVNLVCEISKKTEKTILLVAKYDYDLINLNLYPNLIIEEIPKKYKFFGKTSVNAYSKAKDIILKYNINIVHDTFGMLFLLFIFKKKYKNCKFFTSLYNLSEWDFFHFLLPKYKFNLLKYRGLHILLSRIPVQRIICAFADKVVLQAPGLIERLNKLPGTNLNKIAWIPNNINIKDIDIYNEARCKSFKNEKVIKLLFVGSLCIGKGGVELLNLIKYFKDNNIEINVDIIGDIFILDKNFMESLIIKNELNDLIKFHSVKSKVELNDFYKGSDFLFHMSYVEGSPRVVLEALAYGLPVIASNHPGIKVLDSENKYILFFDFKETELIFNKIMYLKNNKEEYLSISKIGQECIIKTFGSEVIADKYISLYKSMCENK